MAETFKKKKDYDVQLDGSKILTSKWTSTDTVEMTDGKTLTTKLSEVDSDIETLNGTGEGSVDKKIADALSQKTYLTKTIVTKSEIDAMIADPSTAEWNVIYMVKDDSATGDDKYLEYQKLGTEESSTVECTGDTSTDLSEYVTNTTLNEKIGDGVTSYRDVQNGQYAATMDTKPFSTTAMANANVHVFDYFRQYLDKCVVNNDNKNILIENLNDKTYSSKGLITKSTYLDGRSGEARYTSNGVDLEKLEFDDNENIVPYTTSIDGGFISFSEGDTPNERVSVGYDGIHITDFETGEDRFAVDINGEIKSPTIDKVNNDLHELGFANIQFTSIANKYITREGDEFAYNGWSCTDYLDCNGIKQLYVLCDNDDDNPYNAFYDANKNFIKNFAIGKDNRFVDVPSNATYFRLSSTTSLLNVCKVSTLDNFASEVASVNAILVEQGLIDVATKNYFYGYYYNISTRGIIQQTSYMSDSIILSIKPSDKVTVVLEKNNGCIIGISSFSDATTAIDNRSASGALEYTVEMPNGAKNATVWIQKSNITQSDFGSVSVYVNNELCEVKAALNGHKLFRGILEYNGSVFPFSAGGIDQFVIIGRNISTGSIVTAWYDHNQGGFVKLSGDISNGQYIGTSFVY